MAPRARPRFAFFVLFCFAIAASSFFLVAPRLNIIPAAVPRAMARGRLPAPTAPMSFEMAQIQKATAEAWAAYVRTGMLGDDLQPIAQSSIDYMHVRATLYVSYI